MKAFKCDGVQYCGECYLDILNDTDYKALVVQFTQLVEIDNDKKCDNCGKLCSSMESLNSFKKVYQELEKINESN